MRTWKLVINNRSENLNEIEFEIFEVMPSGVNRWAGSGTFLNCAADLGSDVWDEIGCILDDVADGRTDETEFEFEI